MEKKTIGIPRGLLYYRYNILWKNYFKLLGFNIITSPKTNKAILEAGNLYSIDESCLSSKIYIGHVYYLKDKCNYILIPRICDYGKKEKVCVKFNATYDIIKNTFLQTPIITYNIEKTKKISEPLSLIKLGIKLTNRPIKVIISYIISKIKERNYLIKEYNKQENLLKNNNNKLLIVSHPYNIYDNYIGNSILQILKKYNYDILYSDKLDRKKSVKIAQKLSPTLYWTYSKELIGSIQYYQNIVKGIIFITSFPCGPDSLVNELMIRKINNKPTLNIIIDELTSLTGIETRIESFIDIIKESCEKNE